jgi:hypothetical protein
VAYVPTSAATVSGELTVTGDRASLSGSSVVTALDRTAVVTLARGGSVDVCQTSSLHITGSSDALMLALDRGALELHLKANSGDVLLTPDLRFTFGGGGPLDLRLRVVRNGDTCVESRGRKAPVLHIGDQFGEQSYELKPNQHVLFEHGSLKEVDDHEEVPCGCPPPEPGTTLADALLSGKPTPQGQHPFPAAVSEGLAEPTPPPAETPGETHTQISASLTYNAASPVTPVAAEPPPTAMPQPTAPPPAPHGFAYAVGHFFRRIFGGG